MNVMVVAGARPNFMKVAPVLVELAARGHQATLVHTGQHHDESMSQAFFDDLRIPKPDFFLGVGGGTHANQTARIMIAFEEVLLTTKPRWVVVPGDVNSTLAAAIVTVKLREELGVSLAHLEAGLRSMDWRMPEEVNRVLTDRCSDLLLTPSRDAEAHLLREGIDPARIAFVGNIMIDTLLQQLPAARELNTPRTLGLDSGRYIAATLHRPSNVDNRDALEVCLRAFAAAAELMPVVLPVHPRTRKNIEAFGLSEFLSRLIATEPMSYTEMLSVTEGAALVLTDSGGLQEETSVLGVPCLTLREQTERPITISQGTNRLAAWPLSVDGINTDVRDLLHRGRRTSECRIEGWDGQTSKRVVDALERKSA